MIKQEKLESCTCNRASYSLWREKSLLQRWARQTRWTLEKNSRKVKPDFFDHRRNRNKVESKEKSHAFSLLVVFDSC